MGHFMRRKRRTSTSVRLVLLCIAILVACVAAIWLVDVEDSQVEKQINLTIQVIGLLATVVGVIVAFVAPGKSNDSELPPAAVPRGHDLTFTGEAQDQATSLRILSKQLTKRLRDLDGGLPGFVDLTISAKAPDDSGRQHPLNPRLEVLLRGSSQHVDVQPDQIDISEVQSRFSRAVLLGEPGSGKSTCLRQMAFRALDALVSDSQNASSGEGRLGWSNDEQTVVGAHDRDGLGGQRIPLYVSLSEWEDPRLRAFDFLLGQLTELVGSRNYLVRNFEDLLVDGRFLLLCDGLNELPGRSSNSHEGRRQGTQGTATQMRDLTARIDARERSLRDLAAKVGLRSQFILSCRGHEYFESLQWEVIRVLPMSPNQIDSFIATYADPAHVGPLRMTIARNAPLRDMASNPFFLCRIVGAYSPGISDLTTRGALMTYLYRQLLEREWGGRDDAVTDESVRETAGRLAFRMFAQGRIGSQAPLPEISAHDRPSIDVLAATGLIVSRDGNYFFYHQIVQEYFVAMALADRTVGRKPATLLADKSWTEVVALWLDLAPDIYGRVVKALAARNLPWRRPSSPGSYAYVYFSMVSSLVIIVVLTSIVLDWIFWPGETLASPLGVLGWSPFVWIAMLAVLRLTWRVSVPHRKVIINAVRVLSLREQYAATPRMLSAFSRVLEPDRVEMASDLGSLGLPILPHCLHGLNDRRWQVRAGCVMTIGQIAKQGQGANPDVIATLLCVARSADPSLAVPALQALRYVEDERVPQAIADILDGSRRGSGVMVGYQMSLLTKWSASVDEGAFPINTERLQELIEPDQPSHVRSLAVTVMAIFAVPGSAEHLGGIAEDYEEEWRLRKTAMSSLGLMSTSDAAAELVRLATMPGLFMEVASALRRLRGVETVPALAEALSSRHESVREASAATLGKIGGPQALEVLKSAADDVSSEVRAAVALALGAIGDTDCLDSLATLARDPESRVRTAAFDALEGSFPDQDIEILAALAVDSMYVERIRAARLLTRHTGSDVESALRDLTADRDPEVSELAQRSLITMQAARVGRSPGANVHRNPVHAMNAFWRELLQWDSMKAMRREERLNGVSSQQMFNTIQNRIYSDAELTRKFRNLVRVVAALVLVGIVLLVFCLLLLLRVAHWGSQVELDHWVLSLIVILLGGLTWLPGVRRLVDIPVIRFVPRFLRIATYFLIGVAVIGALYYVWWSWLALAGVVAGFYWLRERHRRRGRRLDLATSAYYRASGGSVVVAS
jgi:HEAT repeat protein